MRTTGIRMTPDVQVTVRGDLPPALAERAGRKVKRLFGLAHRPVLAASVRLSRHGNPAVDQPVVAQANLDVSGRRLRAQVAAPTAEEAIYLLEAKLRCQLERSALHWQSRRGRPGAEPGEWRHDSPPGPPMSWFPIPEDEREIVRRKSYSLARSTVDDAFFEMHLLDYDFHLFTESGTGQDSVLYHAGPTLHRLAQSTPPGPHRLSPFRLAVTVSRQSAPVLTTAEAVDRLGLLGSPFLFFVDAGSSRGSLLYHRYDGHYGLIAPDVQLTGTTR
ncbi:ribosome hibernation promotion factor [Amycolatopsis speibonae]|uniref:HPF/RaiA family ribosome-associated protein n=1 Tax=Amycolatopsis speibonae TaxID=1450224 RepID=A0ABV7P8S5_9PSEU